MTDSNTMKFLVFNEKDGLRETACLSKAQIGTYVRYYNSWQVLSLAQHQGTHKKCWYYVQPEALPKRLKAEALLLGVQL